MGIALLVFAKEEDHYLFVYNTSRPRVLVQRLVQFATNPELNLTSEDVDMVIRSVVEMNRCE